MTHFFWTILLPLSATGACAAVLLRLLRPLLHRMGRTQWPVCVVTAALCLFVIPASLLAPRFLAMQGTTPSPTRYVSVSGGAAPSAAQFFGDSFPLSADASRLFPDAPLPFAAMDTANADDGTVNAKGVTSNRPVSHAAEVRAAGVRSVFLRVLPLFWAAGMALVLLYSAIAYLRFSKRMKRSSRAVTDAAMLARLRAAREKSGVRRMPELRRTEAIASPLAMGTLRPCIYLPADVPADTSLDYALQHECVHLSKGHLFWKLAAQAICAVHWFNPAAWLLAELLNEACEFACDRAVADALDGRQRKSYCAALLDAADQARAPRCVSAFSRPAAMLHRRIEAVLAPRPKLCRRVVSVAVCAALVLCASGLAACAAGQAADSVASQLPQDLSADGTANGLEPPLDSAADSAADGLEPAQSVPAPEGAAASLAEDGASEPDAAGSARVPGAFTEWAFPVPEVSTITGRFAEGFHRGVDLAAPKGTDILAANGGTVLEAEFHSSWGNYVLLEHENGMTTRYAHCSELLVQAGESVAAGQVIARVGSTGYATGNICHVEVTQDDTLIDPLSVLPAHAT